MTEELIIRPAERADLPAITAIYADAVLNGTASYEMEAPGLDEMTGRWQTLTGNLSPYFVAVRGGRIAGYAYAGPYRPRPAYRFTVENAIYIAPDAHRSGIGRALLQRLVEECEELGFRQMMAVIGDGTNHAASVGLHAALGFRQIGVIEGSGYKHQRWLDTVLMQRPLGDGKSSPPREISR